MKKSKKSGSGTLHVHSSSAKSSLFQREPASCVHLPAQEQSQQHCTVCHPPVAIRPSSPWPHLSLQQASCCSSVAQQSFAKASFSAKGNLPLAPSSSNQNRAPLHTRHPATMHCRTALLLPRVSFPSVQTQIMAVSRSHSASLCITSSAFGRYSLRQQKLLFESTFTEITHLNNKRAHKPSIVF